MVDAVFAFGQRGGFHFESPSKWQLSARVPELWPLFHHSDPEFKIEACYSLTLGAANSFFVSYKSKTGSNRINSDNLPQNLKDFLYEKDSSGDYIRDFPKLKVTLGPYNKSWYASDGKVTRWCDLPPGLTKEINSKRDNNGTGSFNDMPRMVALGYDGNYFMATEKGSWAWLLTSYPDLQAIIRGCKGTEAGVSNLKSLVLSPYRINCWVVQTTSGVTVSSNLPPYMEEPFNIIKSAVQADTEARTKLLEGMEREKAEKAELERSQAQQAAQAEVLRRQQAQLAQLAQWTTARNRQNAEIAAWNRMVALQQTQNAIAAIQLGMIMGGLNNLNFGGW